MRNGEETPDSVPAPLFAAVEEQLGLTRLPLRLLNQRRLRDERSLLLPLGGTR
jgi:hypothetical protein